VNDESRKGMNEAERDRTRASLSEKRADLRRALRATDDEVQRADIQVRLDAIELERARVNRMALAARDDDADVVALIGKVEDAANELHDEVDAFVTATENARRFASLIASADKALASLARLAALVF